MTTIRTIALLSLVTASFSLVSCKQEATAPAQTASPAAPGPNAKPGIAIGGARLVLPAVKGNPAAAYFTVGNAGTTSVTLQAVAIDGVGKTEMHETKDGKMSPVGTLEIKANGGKTFSPGGLHVMAFELDPKLAVGGTTEVTLIFADGDKLSSPMRIEAVGEGHMDHTAH